MFTAHDKILSLSHKLRFWASCIENSNVDDILIEVDCVLNKNICREIADHIHDLEMNLVKYLPPMNDDNNWVQNVFKIMEKPANFTTKDYENIIEITSDSQVKQNFNKLSVINFGSSLIK